MTPRVGRERTNREEQGEVMARTVVTAPESLMRTAPENVSADRTPLLSCEGEYWTIVYDGRLLRVRDAKGLRYLARLLQSPGERMSAADLLRIACDPEVGCDAVPSDQQARLPVTKCIKASIAKIDAHHPSVGHHLRTCIKTGASCAYLPDPARAAAWTVRVGAAR